MFKVVGVEIPASHSGGPEFESRQGLPNGFFSPCFSTKICTRC